MEQIVTWYVYDFSADYNAVIIDDTIDKIRHIIDKTFIIIWWKKII